MNDTAPIAEAGLDPKFWERKNLTDLSQAEWEALCDGCGKCCLNKLEDEDSGEVALTNVACRLLNNGTCRCTKYTTRREYVPECISLTPESLGEHMYWIPQTCAYRLIYEGRPLFDWHPLVSGSSQTVHDAGISMQNSTVPEHEIDEDDWEEHIIKEPM